MSIAVVTGDIVKSRDYSPRDREWVQKELTMSWKQIRRFFPDEFRSKLSFRITAGDEFQYVCNNFSMSIISLMMLRIRMRTIAVKPLVTIRAAIGIGTQTVKGDTDSYTQDGPAFRLAREGIEELHKSGLYRLTVVCGLPKHRELLTNDILALSDRIYAKWTNAQAIVLMHAVSLKPPGEIARILGLSGATISRHLHRSAWYEYSSVMSSIVQDAPFCH